MSIRQDIAAWDRKSADYLGKVYARHANASMFVPEILGLMQEEALQVGTTWLLKRYLDEYGHLPPDVVDDVYASLPTAGHWETKLHVLQSIPNLPIPSGHKSRVEAFLRACLGDEKKFVRAWAYGGFYELARQYPEYRPEAEKLLENALREEPASVKARIRRVTKRGFR